MTPCISLARIPEKEEGYWAGEEDNDALLAKHTKVRVVGNNRTRAGLVGQVGIVKRAVGLGGWHWLRLASGEEARLQRNALRVLQLPQGDELEVSEPEEAGDLGQTRVGHCTEDNPCERRPTRLHQQRIDFSKLAVGSLKRYRQFYEDEMPELGPAASREHLAQAVGRHFMRQVVDERTVIADFFAAVRVHAAKRRRM